MSLKIGDVAPDFSLLDHNLNKVNLRELKGHKVVLLFFPLANTGVCTKEMCTFRDELKAYENLDAKVLGVSVDSPFTLKLWAEKNNYNFPLLSDFNKEVSRKYGAFYDTFLPEKLNLKGVAKRSAFVIDENGVIKYAEVLEDASKEPSYENIKNALK